MRLREAIIGSDNEGDRLPVCADRRLADAFVAIPDACAVPPNTNVTRKVIS